jgi:FkbM family methyltransferase
MNVLIDCGSHNGENWDWFAHRCKYKNMKIYGFEPNPDLQPRSVFLKHVEIFNKAVSTHNGKQKFFIMENDVSSSFYRKKNEKVKKEIEVECVDLCEWIEDNISEKDNVFLKLDVEGEEHKIVPELMKKGIFENYINEMYVEFHQKKLRNLV